MEGLKPHASARSSGQPGGTCLPTVACVLISKFAQGNVHTYVILMYLLRKIYLSNITQLLICFALRGVECTLAFINLRGREHLVGQAEEGEFELPTLLAAGGALSLPCSLCDPSSLGKLQVCHQILHLGPKL
uniref:Uncharacterized protein n=1 Tax=Pipistrellus kuhlii TaxID=59472 RepID=A0A7J7XVR8_PIPKU|nr:hypothetical protein mPipKuh1_010411 [Pipistrellus kuhlii]